MKLMKQLEDGKTLNEETKHVSYISVLYETSWSSTADKDYCLVNGLEL